MSTRSVSSPSEPEWPWQLSVTVRFAAAAMLTLWDTDDREAEASLDADGDVAEQLGRKAAALNLAHRFVVVVAEPDADHLAFDAANEPCVAKILRRSGLACHHSPRYRCLSPSAACHYSRQHL